VAGRARLWTPIAIAVAALVAPVAASAHAGGVEYRFPLPIWMYALGAGAAVFASAPAAAFALRSRRDRLGPDLYRYVRPLRLGALGLTLTSLLLLEVLVGGLFGNELSFTANPAPLIIWVDFWIGLGIVSALVGNVWDFVSPLNAVARALDRRLARRGLAARRYPDALGVWPAVLLLGCWTWAELLWEEADRGGPLALTAIVYVAVQLIGCALFGAEVWLGRAELFTVVARTLSRFAPLELYVRESAGPCDARRCADGDRERVGCPSCWLAAEPAERGLRLRGFGAGTRREGPLGRGGGAFVAVLLATVVYDGWRSTGHYAEFERWLAPGLPAYTARVGTLTMVAALLAFTLALALACWGVSRVEGGGFEEIMRRYAPTLVPIAAVYFISHYFLYWLIVGQSTIGTILDPLDRGWAGDTGGWFRLSGGEVWWTQVTLIVWGHIVAVIEAHRISAGHHRTPKRALLAQIPLVLLMVAYTYSGLWVLGHTLRAPGG
jgi:hypothetical protein